MVRIEGRLVEGPNDSWLHRRRGCPINRDDVGGAALVIRNEHCVLRIAHNDVRLAVDLLSGEMYSAELVRS